MIEFNETELVGPKVKIFQQQFDKDAIVNSELPQDLILVEYEINDKLYCDACRAAKKVDAFDLFYDKVNALGGKIISMTSSIGYIPPRLYQG